MEGKALIAAMRDSVGTECQIYSDSEFWVNVITKWSPSWKTNGWRKKGGDIKNLDLVQEAHDMYQKSKAQLIWVRGHNGNTSNEQADVWANRAREQRLDGYLTDKQINNN